MLLLTIASGVLLLLLLVVLGFALARIELALDGVVASLQKIAWGVRAIEQQTAPLKSHVVALKESLTGLAEGFGSVEQSLRKVA